MAVKIHIDKVDDTPRPVVAIGNDYPDGHSIGITVTPAYLPNTKGGLGSVKMHVLQIPTFAILFSEPLFLRPRLPGRGSRPVRAASRSRKAGEPSGRPSVSAARSAVSVAGFGSSSRRSAKRSGASVEQRRHGDKPVVAARPDAPARSTSASPAPARPAAPAPGSARHSAPPPSDALRPSRPRRSAPGTDGPSPAAAR